MTKIKIASHKCPTPKHKNKKTEIKIASPKSPVQERKNKVISITLRQSDLTTMDDFCAATGMSRSTLIRLAVQKYINNNRR